MPALEDIETRLKTVMNDPDNQGCSECDRVEYKPIWASFLTCPVDGKRLGVVCCKKCYKLFNKVEGGDFTLKSLEDLKDWTGEDIEALELGGNKVVNACYEATVTNERDGRDKRKYGYEALFFEKYINMTHFDEVLYKQMINQASKALVEKRFNKSLKGYNLKKSAAEDSQSNLNFDDDGSEYDSNEDHSSSQGEPAAPSLGRRAAGMQRASSTRGIQSRRQIANRRRQSARNLMAGDDEEGGEKARPSMSRQRMNSRREMLEDREDRKSKEREDGNALDANGRVRRSLSARKLSVRNLAGDSGHERGDRNVRRQSSNRKLPAEDREMRRQSSARRMAPEERGVQRNASREEKDDRGGVRRQSSGRRVASEDSGEEKERVGGHRDRRNGRHRLLA